MKALDKLKRIDDCKGRLKELVGNDGIIQLAKDGKCPHYVVKNPITGEETMWFIPSEINEWLDENYTTYKEGFVTEKYQFIHFNKEELKAVNIPPQLSKIKNLYELPLSNINTPPGIYFLCKNQDIQYIGRSVNVAQRIITHVSEGFKDFDSIYFISCSVNYLCDLETSCIRYFNPPYNVTNAKPPSQRDLNIVESLFLNV